MKSSCLRPLVALLIALGLSACGGKESFDVSGVITGLSNSGLVLLNGADTVAPPAGATAFTFPNRVDYGTDYNITIQTQPAHMTCAVSGGNGSAGHYLTISASVTCSQNTYSVGGTITGLTVAGLELGNGSNTTVIPVLSATSFVMPNLVADGKFYGITVITQPAGLTCTVANGTGTMGAANVENVAVSCVPNP